MKEKIIHCFNKSAKTYDLSAKVQEEVAKRLDWRLPVFKAQDILEIGCGTGLFSQKLLTTYPEASLLLTDIAPSMIEVCKNRLAFSPQISFACLDGEKLSTTSFDLIVSSMALHWFTNLKKSFNRIIASLKPGGIFTFAMLGKNSLYEWREICKKNCISIPIPQFPEQNKLQKMFPDMEIDTEIISYPYRSLYDFLKTLKKIGATPSHPNHEAISSRKLRSIFHEFNQEMTMRYEVIYGKFEKP